jgi:hypothetical protein
VFTKDLSANATLQGQEQCTWCGAASGQMIRGGYPNPADRAFYTQLYIWNTIQVYNSIAPADSAWATDPHGLTGCLQSLSNPPGVHWAEFANASRDTVLFDILFWLNRREFPCAVLINKGGHWVVIVGFVTDVEPIAGSTPTLQSIDVYDPEPHNVGTHTTFTGAQWFGGPWNGSIIYTGTWFNQYVAVVEPPIEQGKVQVEQVMRTGRRLLSAAQAAEYAVRWIDELKLAERSTYSLLGREDVGHTEPLLVREETGGRRVRNVPQYYIVPFGFNSEFGDRGSRTARVCVLVNAYTGNLEEVTAFGKPVRYLPREEALDVVASAMQTDREQLRDAEASLMFQPSDITHVRSFPFWRVRVGDRTLYVDQLGKLYGKLLPSIPGD